MSELKIQLKAQENFWEEKARKIESLDNKFLELRDQVRDSSKEIASLKETRDNNREISYMRGEQQQQQQKKIGNR